MSKHPQELIEKVKAAMRMRYESDDTVGILTGMALAALDATGEWSREQGLDRAVRRIAVYLNDIDGASEEELQHVIDIIHEECGPAYGATEWASGLQPIDTAPKTLNNILGVHVVDRTIVRAEIVHFAHGGGEEQPRFGPGWFYRCGEVWVEMDPPPTHWMPCELGAGVESAAHEEE